MAISQRAENDLDALVAVVMLVPRCGAVTLGPQGREAVTFRIELTGIGPGGLGMEEISIFGHHQKDQAIDEAQESVEPIGQVDLARCQPGGEIGVGFKETRAENLERKLDLDGQAVAGDFAFLEPGIAPAFQRAVGRRSTRNTKAGSVDQQPENGERCGILVGEDLREVGLDIGGAGQRSVVAHDAHKCAVGNNAPERFVMLVELVLKRESGRARPVSREGSTASVELFV